MHSTSYLAATAALLTASLVVGVPAPAFEKRSTFTVQQVPNVKLQGLQLSYAAQVAKSHAKYGAAVPASIKAALAVNGSVVATPSDSDDDEYLAPVSIGTPAQVLNLDFDSGSSDLWVFSSSTPSSEVDGQAEYKPSKSSTSKKISGDSWEISYGDESGASGIVYSDKVVIGGATVTSQAVEAATSVSSEFTDDTASDGLVGFAFDSLNTVSPSPVETWFDNLKSSLASPLWTANLKKGQPGNYNFGYIDSSEYTGSISYASVNTANGFWEVTGSGYAIGSGSFVSSSYDTIVDTGTTLLYLPAAQVKAYYAKVSGSSSSSSAGGYIFPCSATLPSFTFGLGSYRGVIPGSYINYGVYSGSTCFGGIQSNAGIGMSIWGDILIKSQFVVFNAASSPQIGLAAKPT